MRRVLAVLVTAILLTAVTTFFQSGTANAYSERVCGSGYIHQRSLPFSGGRISFAHKGKWVCAVLFREGHYYKKRGLTHIRFAWVPGQLDGGYYTTYAGPVKRYFAAPIDLVHVRAWGSVGNMDNYTRTVCASYSWRQSTNAVTASWYYC